MRQEISAHQFSTEEQTLIAAALKKIKPWECPSTKEIRRNIKNFHLQLNEEICCYCQRSLKGEFQLVMDVEHIIPISHDASLAYTIWNTSASCKRCNMLIKKESTEFLVPLKENENSDRYLLAHPNIDKPLDHLEITSLQKGRRKYTAYHIHTEDKGRYTYNFFKLSKLTTNSFDRAQGIEQDGSQAISIAVDLLLDNHR